MRADLCYIPHLISPSLGQYMGSLAAALMVMTAMVTMGVIFMVGVAGLGVRVWLEMKVAGIGV